MTTMKIRASGAHSALHDERLLEVETPSRAPLLSPAHLKASVIGPALRFAIGHAPGTGFPAPLQQPPGPYTPTSASSSKPSPNPHSRLAFLNLPPYPPLFTNITPRSLSHAHP